MNLDKIYNEEDLFPREIGPYEQRDYGVLFHDENNKDSYDSNHAVIFKNQISDLGKVLGDIIDFYNEKDIKPILYQSISDEGYFEEIKDTLSVFGFDSWGEEQKYMVLAEANAIKPNPQITVKKVTEWDEEYGTEIFEKADEPWEIGVARRVLKNENTLFFVAFCEDKPVGMVHAHVRDGVCRGDYLLVAKEYRKMGVGRALMFHFVEHCRANNIENCYLWVEKETEERIYYEAGFREVEVKVAGRAVRKK